MQVMAVIDKQRDGFLAALHDFAQRALTLFRFPREVPVFFRGQVVIQRQFQRTERDAGHINHPRFRDLDLPCVPELRLDAPQQHRVATAHHAGQGHKAALMEGGFELAEELPVMRGCKVVYLPEAFGESKVLHDVATHRLILYRRARGTGAHGPTPPASSRSCAGGCATSLTGPAPGWRGASPGDPQWRVSHPGHCETSVHET